MSKVLGFLRRHRRAEEELAIGAGISIGWRFIGGLLGAGVAAAAIVVPTMIDLSNNNGAGAAAAISQPGVMAVEAKATEGLGFRDSLYPMFRAAAARAHKPFGGYLFLHPDESGRAQADYFMAYAHPRAGDLQPVVDDEMGSPCSSAPTALAALRELGAHGFHPLLYTSAYWLSQLRSCAPALEAYRVWEAEYGPVLNRYAGFHVIGWQYTDNSGVKGLRVDGTHLFVPVSSLEYRPTKPAPTPLTPGQKHAKELRALRAHVRTLRGGFWLWREWRLAIGRFKGLIPHERNARPIIRHRVPRTWWAHLARPGAE